LRIGLLIKYVAHFPGVEDSVSRASSLDESNAAFTKEGTYQILWDFEDPRADVGRYSRCPRDHIPEGRLFFPVDDCKAARLVGTPLIDAA
jgi:hypothetical protein